MKKGIIIGAGIGGVTTAIALAQKGIEVSIYEQAEQLGEVGAGLWVAPNGLKVLDKIGMAQSIIDAGHTLETITLADLKLKPISVINGSEVFQRHGFKTVAIHRATLHNVLVSKLNENFIHLGKKLKSITQTKESATAHFEDGTTETADFIICADGIKSVGRKLIQPELNLRYSGQTCWRFVTNYQFDSSEADKMYEIWSNKKGLRVGYSKINAKQAYVFITNLEKAGGQDNLASLKEKLLELCSEFPDPVPALINSAEASKIIRGDLFDFAPIDKWVSGRVALLGDAAHATTPNLGQGACQAIEDAYELALQIAHNINNIQKALINYQNNRIAKAKYITNTSWSFAKITNTSGILKYLIIAILRLTPKSVSQNQLNKIYNLSIS